MKRDEKGGRNCVQIESRDYCRKALENQQSNWALIDDAPESDTATVYFFHELSGVFDRLTFRSRPEAELELRYNNFYRIADEPNEAWVTGPPPPFFADEHPNGPVYSSGRSWRRVPAE